MSMQPILFAAPWSKRLRTISWIATTACLALAAIAIAAAPARSFIAYALLAGVLIAVPLIAAACRIRGYTLTDAEIHIRRGGWTLRLPLRTLRTVEGSSETMQGSIRLMGNHGLFSFTGWYWNKRLGFHRVYATDPSRAVVLRYPDKIIVITPHDPQHFIMRARTLLKTADFPL